MCIRRKTREKARQSLAFPPVSKTHTHITYMLRQCTSIVYRSQMSVLWVNLILTFQHEHLICNQERIQDFKLGVVHLKKIAPNGGRREKFWGISCEKSQFYAKKSYLFSNFRGDAGSATGFDSQKLFLLLYFWLLC